MPSIWYSPSYLMAFYIFTYICNPSGSMEMSRKKYISVFLLLTFSVLQAHEMIPHHHHTEMETGTINGLCLINHNDCDDTEGRPEPCHYCNEISFYKISTSDIQKKIRTFLVLVIPSIEESCDYSFDFESHRYATFKIPSIHIEYYGSISLRAPPVFI